MDRNDARALADVAPGIPRGDVAATVRTLRTIRGRFEITLRWRAAIEQV